jgi:outer membrane protein W
MKEAVKVVVVAALAGGLFQSAPARAEDERGRWSFAIGLGMHSTFDDIRSNAGEVVSAENLSTRPPDGDLSNDRVVTFDPRQDDLMGRATKVEEKQRFDFSAAYGLTSWLSLQVDTGLYQGDVAPLDVLVITERIATPSGVITDLNPNIVQEGVSEPITVGRLTQIPISVNAVVRFRRDSPFNPFLGFGVGYMFNSLSVNGSFDDLNSQILRGFNRVLLRNEAGQPEKSDLINLQEIYSGFVAQENSSSEPGGQTNLVYNVDCTNIGDSTPGITNTCTPLDPDARRLAALPTQPFIHTDVQDGFLYQFSVGADYHLNERWSAYVSARYLVTDSRVSVRIEGNDPVQGPFSLQEATFRYTAETNKPAKDQGEGRFEICTPPGAPFCTDPATAQKDPLQERILVQGGNIGLSAFTLGAGIRFTF